MAKQCRLCGGAAELCGKNIYGEEVYECTICHEPGHHSRFDDVTLFTEVTKSPEALAEILIYMDYNYYKKMCGFTSLIVDGMFFPDEQQGKNHEERYLKARDKAIAATVAKLNEVVDYE